ncbi:MAG TPA: hypothetical protein PKA13_25985 [Geminicoccaceae bacterium]|nr:hypothetical protein [Geminicoccus sp.]HMU53248.1 hypothetical protein [Geminicoccaceae bacterium]
MRKILTLLSTSALLALAGCAGGGGGPDAAQLAAFPGAEAQIRNLYDSRAVERDWFCPEPQMNAITRAAPTQDTADTLVLAVSYEFSSTTAGNARDQAACSGFNTRMFTFGKAGGGLALQSMTGEQRS